MKNEQDDISNKELLRRVEQSLASQRERFLRLPEVMHRTGMKRSSVMNRVAALTFPAGQTLSGEGRMRVWLQSEVDAWIQSEIEAYKSKTA